MTLKDIEDSQPPSCLTADIGGTNIRFGLVDGVHGETGAPRITHQMSFACEAFESVDVAMQAYQSHIGRPLPELVSLAVAGPVNDGHVDMTNRNWHISGPLLRDTFGFHKVIVMNDAEAVAFAVTVSEPSDFVAIKSGESMANSPKAAITVGTGLGVAALIKSGGVWLPAASEAGHTTLAPHTSIESAIFDVIRRTSSHVSAEMLLSGIGIQRLHRALGEVVGVGVDEMAPEDVTQRAIANDDVLCRETMDVYCGLLGSFAGDVALSFTSRGGLFFAGNVLRQIAPLLENSNAFRERFVDKGPMSGLLDAVPVSLMTVSEPGLVGASAWLQCAATGKDAG